MKKKENAYIFIISCTVIVILGVVLGIQSQASTSVPINIDNFPSDSFRQYVIDNFDTNGDRSLSDSELKNITTIKIYTNDLKGIEYFRGLKSLECKWSSLSSLDVSACPDLTHLDCSGNQLSSLDVSSCPNLTYLNCSSNKLGCLDASGCPNLTTLYCGSNRLSSLDVSACPNLLELGCGYNGLENLDVSGCPNLTHIDCESTRLDSLNVSGCSYLESLYCANNYLSSLDVSKCPQIKILDCENNKLSSLDVNACPDMRELICSTNSLSSLDVSACSELTEFVCDYNSLSSLNVSSCPNLKRLVCSYNRLSSLEVSGCSALERLLCQNNILRNLDVSTCYSLMQLDCYSNNLTSLNVENCNKCPAVRAFDNKIEIRDANIDTNTLQGFDIRKASDWVNAVIEGTVVRAIDPEKEITYKYDCGGANLNNFAFIPPGRIYTVHFDARGGNCSIENKLVAYDTSYGVLPTPTRTGYTFNGWLDSIAPNQDHHFIREGTIYKKTADSTLYASWAVKLYKVTFDAMGGRCCKEYMFTSYYSGSSLWYDYLPVPTREGYTFAGWFDASTGGNLVEHGTKYTKTTDSTLYAHWLANQYIVTFDAAGGSCTVKNISVKYGTPFGTLPAVTRDGYSFDGWYLQPEGEAAYKITPETIVAITTGSTAYAHWRKNPVPTPKPAPNHISGGGTSGGHNSAAAPQTASFQKKKSVIRAKIAGAGKIKLTWKKIKGASKYSIYYKTSAKGKYKLLKAVRKTSYTVPKLKSSKKYYFKVKGSAVIGGRTVFTQFSKAVFKKAVGKPPTPKLSGSMKGNILILNWGKLKGISKIVIDRKVGNTRYKRFKTGNGKGIGYVKKLEDYNPSQKYSFRIRICYLKDGVEIWSSSSNSVIL